MRTRFLPVWFLAVALMGIGLWQGNHDAAQAATYYVTNNNDVGAGSLRAAVLSATDGDKVRVVTPGPILLNSTIAITRSITIAGPEIAVNPMADPTMQDPLDTGQVVIGGIVNSVNGSVFTIASGKSVAMSHLFITGGVASGTTFSAGAGDDAFGGGIYNAGNLTLNYCTIAGNQANAGNGLNAGGIAYGGGIYSTGTLTLNQSTVDNNVALGGSGANNIAPYDKNAAYGGGIYSIGTTNINSSTVSNNIAQGGTSASSNGGSAIGGGVAQSSSGTLRLTNSTIASNLAKSGIGSSSNGSAVGGGVAVNNATLIPLNATITANTVTAGITGSPITQGSGLAYYGSAQLTINNCLIAGNTDTDGSATDLSGAANQNGSFVNGAFSGSLGANGGPTLTVDINGTGAVNAGDNGYSSSLSLDQRGAARLKDASVDAGAVEDGAPLTTVPPLMPSTIPFDFQLINGTATFTKDQFNRSILPANSIESIVVSNITNGDLKLNGQKLENGSVISKDDLDKLTFVQTDLSGIPSFDWSPSDSVNPVTLFLNAQEQPDFVPNDNDTQGTDSGVNDPIISSVRPASWIYYGGAPSFTVVAQSNVQSVRAPTPPATTPPENKNKSVSIVVTDTVLNDGLLTSGGSWTGSASTTDGTVAKATVSCSPENKPGIHTVNVTATNVHGVKSTQRFQFLVDLIPVISNQSSITSPQSINLGETFTQQLEGADPDYYIPGTTTEYDRLKFRVDQQCYGTDGECDDNNTDSNIGSFTDSNLTGNLPAGTTLSTKFNWKPTKVGKYRLKVSLTDYWGYPSTSFVFTVFVNPPAAPIVTNPGDQTAQLNDPFNLNIHATGANLTYSASNLPTGLSINSSTGEISGTPTVLGNKLVTVTVNDGINPPVSITFTINVINGDAPVITSPTEGETIFAPVDAPYNFQVQATDPNGDTLTYDDGGTLPAWAQIDHSTGLITSVSPAGPTSSDVGATPVTLTVSDGTYTTTAHYTLSVVVGNPPTISVSPTGPVPATTGIAIPAITVTAKDVDDSDLVFSLGSGAPSGLTLSQTSFANVTANTPVQTTLQWTPTSSQAGIHTFNVVVTNSQSLSASVTVTINVTASSVNHPPVVQNPGTWKTSVNAFSTFSVFANDSDGDSLTYTRSANMPGWVVLTPSAAGVILSGTPGPGDVGTTSVSIDVSDGTNTVSIPFNIEVAAGGTPSLQATPTAPANPEQVTIGDGYSKIFVSHDNDYPETLTFNAVVTQVAGSGGNVGDATLTTMYEAGSPTSGYTAATRFNWTPDTAGTYKVVVTVTDGAGNSNSLTFSIHVSSPPKIQVNGVTTPVTFNVTPEMPLAIPVAISDPDDHETLTVDYDHFSAPFNLSFSGSSSFSDVPGNTPKFTGLAYTPSLIDADTTFIFNVTVTDGAGLTASQQVTINVGPANARPVITSPTAGSNVNVVAGHTVNLPVVATDAEGDTLTYDATGLAAVGLAIDPSTGVISGTASGSGSHTVTVTVDDGNHISPAASVTFKIVVGATGHLPTLDPIADQTVIEGQTVSIQANGHDQDNDALEYLITGQPGWLSIDPTTGLISGLAPTNTSGSWNITVTVDDHYEGTASQDFTLTVVGPFSSSVTSGAGYETITYTVFNNTANTINPVVRGSLTGGGYLDNANAFFNASQGFVDDQWASPALQRKLDPTKNTRILTWTVGNLAPGQSATLSISVPINGSTPHGTALTNTWSVDYGATHQTLPPVTHP